jgi:hypothetical protein
MALVGIYAIILMSDALDLRSSLQKSDIVEVKSLKNFDFKTKKSGVY